MKIDRVILSTSDHPSYLPFLPVVARAWEQALGATPTVAVIAAADVAVDPGPAEVLRFTPIPGIDPGLHAQLIRLLLPTYFPQEVSLLSDIDMVPLNSTYFTEAVRAIPTDRFVVFRDLAYGVQGGRYPICYNVARGDTFGAVFGVTGLPDVPVKIAEWAAHDLGWYSDELLLARHLHEWPDFEQRCVRLGDRVESRVDRSNWQFDAAKARAGGYVDAHLPRPLDEHRDVINEVLSCVPANGHAPGGVLSSAGMRTWFRRMVRRSIARLGYRLVRAAPPSVTSVAELPEQLVDPYGSHLILLAAVIQQSANCPEPVLELGMGDYSTSLLHLMCRDRRVVSVDTNATFVRRFDRFRSDHHEVHAAADWPSCAIIEREKWSVAFVDAAPAHARGPLIDRLRGRARFVVVHDTEPDTEAAADYDMDVSLNRFRYRTDYRLLRPWTTVVSDEAPFTVSAVEGSGPGV